MNKKTFLHALSSRIRGLSRLEREESLAYYAEMIDDRVEAGMTQEEAVGALGSVEEIAAQILQGAPHAERRELKCGRTKGEIALLALGSPLWIPLLIALIVIVFSLYIVLWSLAVSLYAVAAGCAAGALGGLLGIVISALRGNLMQLVLCFSITCALAGLTFVFLPVCMRATGGLVRLGGRMMRTIRAHGLEGRLSK